MPTTGECPHVVRRAAMVHRWDTLAFLHWRYDAAEVQRLLPPSLEVETCDGTAWVGLVPFYLRVRVPGLPYLPWASQFPETNVRTYVRAPDESSGIWFFSLDAARLGAVVVARAWYRLPYFWDRMRLEPDAGPHTEEGRPEVVYDSSRRWPGPRAAVARARLRVGEPFRADELHDLDHFLTARWNLYSTPRKGLSRALAWHAPWPLHRAEVVDLDPGVVQAAGLSAPTGDPLVHWSPGVEVRIGWPHPVRTRR